MELVSYCVSVASRVPGTSAEVGNNKGYGICILILFISSNNVAVSCNEALPVALV